RDSTRPVGGCGLSAGWSVTSADSMSPGPGSEGSEARSSGFEPRTSDFRPRAPALGPRHSGLEAVDRSQPEPSRLDEALRRAERHARGGRAVRDGRVVEEVEPFERQPPPLGPPEPELLHDLDV